MSAAVAVRRPVLADLLPGALVRDVALVLAAVLVVAATAQIRIELPFTPVPLTGQTFGVLLVGAALGPARGAIALLAYLLVSLGLPFYAGGESGVTVWQGATAGYLAGFPLAAAIIGRMARAGHDRSVVGTVGAFVLASLAVLVPGTLWLHLGLGMPAAQAIEVGLVPFLLGDLAKAVLAAGLLPGAWALVGRADRAPSARA